MRGFDSIERRRPWTLMSLRTPSNVVLIFEHIRRFTHAIWRGELRVRNQVRSRGAPVMRVIS